MTPKFKARFQKDFKRCNTHERERITEAVQQICNVFQIHQAPEGLGLKKLFSREGLGAIFEARATIAIRIVFVVDAETMTFAMIGNHEDVRRFIKSFR